MQIGFLGLGTMGAPMAANLVKAGHDVRVWNRSKAKITPLADAGATPAASPAEAAAGAEAIIGMLADDAATRAVFVDGGALDALAQGAIWVNMATNSLDFAREMAALCTGRSGGAREGARHRRP